MTHKTPSPPRKDEAGFSLAEALIAILVLLFGLASIFNLMIVATTTNTVANQSSGAVAIAAQQMEVLRSTPFDLLVDSPADSLTVQRPGFFSNPLVTVEGVGVYETRWFIATDPADPNLKFLQVQAEPRGFRGRQARADFTTLRTCTAQIVGGCPCC